MASGMGAFADGLLKGFSAGQKIAEAKEAKAFRDELKAANEDVKPVEQFTVTGPDGGVQTFDNEDAALKAMQGGDGFQMTRAFMVGDQSFDNAEQAQFAARMANTPAMKLARQAEVAMKYGQPQMAGAFADAHDRIINTNRNLAWNQVDAYERAGNVDGVLNMLAQQSGMGGQFKLVQDDSGQLMIAIERDGQIQPFMGPFKDTSDIFSTVKHGLSVNYNNALALYKHEQTHGLGVRRQEEVERHNRVAEGISAGNLAVSQGHLGIAAGNLNLRQKELDANQGGGFGHRFVTGLGPNNEMVVAPVHWTSGPGGPQAHVGAPQPLPGMQPIQAQDPLGIGNLRPGAQSGKPRVDLGGYAGGSIQDYNASKAPKPGASATAPAVEDTTPTAGATPAAPAQSGGRGINVPDWFYQGSPMMQHLFPRNSGGR